MISNIKDLTLIIPTYNNSLLIEEQIEFWREYEVQILILDGSEKPLAPKILANLPERFQYVNSDQNMVSRLMGNTHKLKTRYSAILFDDEKFYIDSIYKALRILDTNLEIINVSGQVLGFKNTGNELFLMNMYPEFKNSSLNAVDAMERIQNHINPYRMTTLCSISRTVNLKKSIAAMEHFQFIKIPTIFEIVFEIANAAQGPNCVIEDIFWLRNCNNDPQWDQSRKKTLNYWWNNGGSETYFIDLQNSLSKEKNQEIIKLVKLIDTGIRQFILLKQNQIHEKINKKTESDTLKLMIRKFALKYVSEEYIYSCKYQYRNYFRLDRNKFTEWGKINEIIAENKNENKIILKEFLVKMKNTYNHIACKNGLIR